jgi:hypothetical protein
LQRAAAADRADRCRDRREEAVMARGEIGVDAPGTVPALPSETAGPCRAVALKRAKRLEAPVGRESVQQLRHLAAQSLFDWGIVDKADVVLLVLAELLNNALAHGRTEVLTVRLALVDGWLRLETPDCNSDPPYPAASVPDIDEGGRRVVLVGTLADAWGFRAADGGKSVFAEFQVSGNAAAPERKMAFGNQSALLLMER